MYFKAKFPETILFHKTRHPFTSGIAISNCLDSKCISKSYTRGKKGHVGLIGQRKRMIEKSFLRVDFCRVHLLFPCQPRAKITSKETNRRRPGTTFCNLPSCSFLSLLSLILMLILCSRCFYSTLNLTWSKRLGITKELW